MHTYVHNSYIQTSEIMLLITMLRKNFIGDKQAKSDELTTYICILVFA